MRFACSGPKGEGCASNYSTNDQSHLSRHQRTCGREQRGGARCNSGHKRTPVLNTVRPVPEDTPVDDSSAAATKLSISRTVNAFFANKNMSRRTCACCNELFSPSKMKSVQSAGNWLLRLRNRLSWTFTTHQLTDETRRFYDVSEIEPALANVSLAKAGIVPTMTRHSAHLINSMSSSINTKTLYLLYVSYKQDNIRKH